MKIRKRKLWWDFIVRAKDGGDPGSDPGGDGGGEPGAEPGGGGSGDPPTGQENSGGDPKSGGGEPGAEPGKPGGEQPGKPYWQEDWRSRMARGDEKIIKRLERYASPEAAADALIAAQNRISSGELKTALPKDPSEAELKQWRKDNGIPEAPDKYDLKFDSGLVIGENDKPAIDGFLETAHGLNLTPDQAKGAIEWYFQNQEQQAQEIEQQDDIDTQSTQDELNSEWGPEYRRNINMIRGMMDKIPAEARKRLEGARLPGGKAVFNDPDILRGFAALALEINPAGTLVPSGGGDPMKGVEEEIQAIEKTMKENRSQYNKDEKMQSRYRELLDAREKLSKRSA